MLLLATLAEQPARDRSSRPAPHWLQLLQTAAMRL
jgi:hypothetical protein